MEEIPYASAMRSLMYSMVCTRLDLAYSTSLTSRFMEIPREKHYEAIEWIFRYLKGFYGHGLSYNRLQMMRVN